MSFSALPAAGAKLRASVLSSLITEVRPVAVRKVADETVNNSSVLQNDDELFVPMSANAVYDFFVIIHHNSGGTPDIKFGWTVPSGTTMVWGGYIVNTAGAFTVVANLSQSSTASIGGTGSDSFQMFQGTIVTSSTAGTLQLQWAQDTANASNTIVRAGSYLLPIRTS